MAVIAASAIAIVVSGVAYIRSDPRLVDLVTGSSAAPIKASPKPSSSPWNGTCSTAQLKLTGIFQECGQVDIGMSCPTGSFDQVRVVRLEGTRDDFILYIEVDGAYHGPGTYSLAPWPSDTLGKSDGVAKVALREWVSGNLWESTAGSLTIDKTEESGWIYAGLGPNGSSPVDVKLNIAGWWSCSLTKPPAPRDGGSPCPPYPGEPSMLAELAQAHFNVSAASVSNDAAFVPAAAGACVMDVGNTSFRVAFFVNRLDIAAVHVCPSRAGTRYLYQLGAHTVDSPTELYWTVANDALLWTDNAKLDSSIRGALNGVRPPC